LGLFMALGMNLAGVTALGHARTADRVQRARRMPLNIGRSRCCSCWYGHLRQRRLGVAGVDRHLVLDSVAIAVLSATVTRRPSPQSPRR
jgi:hypothetical protein